MLAQIFVSVRTCRALPDEPAGKSAGARNSHRSSIAWSKSASVILTNPAKPDGVMVHQRDGKTRLSSGRGVVHIVRVGTARDDIAGISNNA